MRMKQRLGMAARTLSAALFLVAIGLGGRQIVAASVRPPCDTDPGTCNIDRDCQQACEAIGKHFGGQCNQLNHCCLCFD